MTEFKKMLLRAAIVVAVLVGLLVVRRVVLTRPAQTQTGSGIEVVTPIEPEKTIVMAASYDMGELAGRQLGGLFDDYLGVQGAIPQTAHIDFCANLASMWKRKSARSGNGVATQTGDELVSAYCNDGAVLMDVVRYRANVDRVITQTRSTLDWYRVAKVERLDDRKIELVRAMAGSLTGDDFLAYALTELMPTSNGPLNVEVFDFLVRNAGQDYVESIPALFDPYTSFGPYQFTQFAWYDAQGERRGGSRINAACRWPVPHGSVARLRGDEHHQAAFLFAVHNLGYTVRSLNTKQLAMLERVWRDRHDDLVQFIAVAHHAPYGSRGAQGAAQRWLDNKARTGFAVSLSSRLVGYAQKTRANLQAIRQIR